MTYKPKFISFDCYGTLIDFEMGPTAKKLFSDRVIPQLMPAFLESFRFYRLDEVLGEWKPFVDVVENAIRRACAVHKIEYKDADAVAIYEAVSTWQPHPNVVESLKSIDQHIPLVILSNSMTDLIPASVKHLQAQFHSVLTAEEAQAYKPRAQIFEYMFDTLNCGPEHMMHVSSSFRYDLMTASDLGFMAKVFIDRNHELECPGFGVDKLTDIRDLPSLVGLSLNTAEHSA